MYHQLHDPAFLAVASGGTPALDLFFSATKELDSRITFTRGSSATFINSSGLVETAGSGVARFTHDPVTLASLGLLIEESRVNSFQRSEEIGVSPWGTQTTTASQVSVTNPSGGSTSSLLTPNSGSPACHVRQQITAAASVYVCSFWIRAGTATTASFLFRDETAGSSLNCTPAVISGTASVSGGSATAQVTGLTSGWARVSFTLNSAAVSGNTLRIYIYPETSGTSTGKTVYVWGVQLEAGAFATSYIPTTSATATRAADVATMTGTNFSSWYNSSEGTFAAGCSTSGSGTRTIIGIDDNTANEMLRIQTETTDPFFRIVDGGVEQAAIDAGTITANTAFKIASSYRVNDFAACVNGGSVGADTSGTIPTVDRLRIGQGQAGNTMSGTIARIRYYRRRLPNANLQTLTT